VAGHVGGNGRLTQFDSQFQEFAVNSWRAPQWVGLRHRANQPADIRRKARSTHAATAFPRPEEPEATTMPREDRLGLHDHDGCSPRVPDVRHPDPQQPITAGEPQPTRPSSFQNLELVSQGEDLELKDGSRPERRAQGQEQRDDDRSHRRRPYPRKPARSMSSRRTRFLVGTRGRETSP
jgi:hypothetical protein